jgi:hypothetical protein
MRINRIIPWLAKVIFMEIRTMEIIWVIPLLNSSELPNVYYEIKNRSTQTWNYFRRIISVLNSSEKDYLRSILRKWYLFWRWKYRGSLSVGNSRKWRLFRTWVYGTSNFPSTVITTILVVIGIGDSGSECWE